MKKLSSILLLVITSMAVKSQTYVNSPLTGTRSDAVYNYNSITLSPGFTGTPGFHAFIMSAPIANCVPLNLSLSQNQNYVLTYTPRAPFQNASLLPNQNVCDVNVNIQYFDGLGRPIQNVMVKGNPDASKDMVQAMQYDAFGRESTKYQPYTSISNNGSYKPDALIVNGQYSQSAQYQFYQQTGQSYKDTPNPYSQTIFEASPLNRVMEQGAPGADWQPVPNQTTGHTMKMDYSTNTAGEVKLWVVNGGGATGTTNYNANELYKTVTKDENWTSGTENTTEEFKDKEGRLVLKRVWETNTKSLSTYYVYDVLGNLSYVLPPAVNENGQAPISSFTDNDANFNNFIYGYKYDGRRRLIEKKIPGKGKEYVVYNKLDQIVLIQDPKQRITSQWIFYKYDGLGRIIIRGLYTDGSSRANLQAIIDAEPNSFPLWEQRSTSTTIGYTDVAFPRNNPSYSVLNYYDDYNFPDNAFGGATGSQSNMIKGLQTGIKTEILGTSNMLLSTIYYDSKGRVIQSKSVNHVSGTDVVDNTYSFVGELLTSNRTHLGNGQTTTIANTYAYDHVGRKKQTQQSINGVAPTILSQQTYNEIGEMKDKTVGNGLNTTQYSYNERGWMKTISSPIFSEELKYQDALNGVAPQYNGNISNQVYTNLNNKTFDYSYDKLNRLLSGVTAGMSEQLSYDVMGNISTLNRNNLGVSNYSYNGNQLQGISGGSLNTTTYVYDINGNVTTDGKNNKTIDYNYLNLPSTVSGGLSYIYDATGQKLKKVSPAGTIDYVQGIQYKNNVIEFIQTEEGIARKSGTVYSYEYNETDHLGNVRVSFYRNPNSGQREVLQRDDYYAFGKRNQVTPGSNDNKYLYNGKELQDELGQYDYGARFYDPEIGRWNVIDPLAEFHFETTSYHYVFNNPVNFIDPLGLDSIAANKANMKTLDVKNDVIVLDEVVVTSFKSPLKEKDYNSVQDNTNIKPYSYANTNSNNKGNGISNLKDINKAFEIGNEINPNKFKFSKDLDRILNVADIVNSENKEEVFKKVQEIAMEKTIDLLIGSSVITTTITTTYNYQNNTPSQVSKFALNYYKEALHFRAMYRATGNERFRRLENQAMQNHRNRVNRLIEITSEK